MFFLTLSVAVLALRVSRRERIESRDHRWTRAADRPRRTAGPAPGPPAPASSASSTPSRTASWSVWARADRAAAAVGGAQLVQERRRDPRRPVGPARDAALRQLGAGLDRGAHRPVLPQQRRRGRRLAGAHHAARLDGRLRAGPLRVPRQPAHLLPVRRRHDVPGLPGPGAAVLRGAATSACSTPTRA